MYSVVKPCIKSPAVWQGSQAFELFAYLFLAVVGLQLQSETKQIVLMDIEKVMY